MSFPVQVVIAGPGLRAVSEAVCRRHGQGGLRPLAWPVVWDDQPDPSARLAAQARRAVERWGRHGEGGFAQVVLADSPAALAEVCAALADAPRDPACWLRVGVVLAEGEALQCDPGDPGDSRDPRDPIVPRDPRDPRDPRHPPHPIDSLHGIPSRVGARRLTGPERVQIAGNLLGLLLGLAQRDDARAAAARLAASYPGPHLTVAGVARFHAAAVHAVLAARLAARVAGRMRAAIAARDALAVDLRALHDLARLRAEGAVAAEARRLADRPAGSGEALDRVRAEVGAATDRWLADLAAEVDRALATGTFGAVAPLTEALLALEGDLDDALARAEPAPGATRRAPARAALESAEAALRRAGEDAAPTRALYAVWALGAAAVCAIAAAPFLGALAGAAALQAALPGGAITAAGAGALATAGVAGGWQRARRARRRAALAAEVEALRAGYERARERDAAGQLQGAAALIERRALRRARAAVARERARLEAIAEMADRLEERFRRESAAPEPQPRPFDATIPVGAAFYEAASLAAPPEEHYRRAELDLAQPSWREALPFMDPEAFAASCRAPFAPYAERVPFASRQDLRAAVTPPTTEACRALVDELDRLVPPGEEAARLLVVPEPLREALPGDLDPSIQVWWGSGDVFAAVIREAR